MFGDASIHVPGQNQCGWLCGASGGVSAHRQAWPSSHITRWWWGERAETLQCQNIQAHTPSPLSNCSLHPHLLTWFFPSPFPPHLPLSLSLILALWQSWHCEKFRAVRGNVRQLRWAICWTHTLIWCHTHTCRRLILALLFSEKLWDIWHNSGLGHTVYHQKLLFQLVLNDLSPISVLYLERVKSQISKHVLCPTIVLVGFFSKSHTSALQGRYCRWKHSMLDYTVYLHRASPSLGGLE